MTPGRIFNAKDEQLLVAEYLGGATPTALGKRWGIHPNTVINIAAKYGAVTTAAAARLEAKLVKATAQLAEMRELVATARRMGLPWNRVMAEHRRAKGSSSEA